MPLTVKELKAIIAGAPDDALIQIPIRTFTRRYPVAYVQAFQAQHFSDSTVRIYCSLAEGASIGIRKGTPADKEYNYN